MKTINNYIHRALITKNTKIRTGFIDVDHLTKDNFLLYDSEDEINPEEYPDELTYIDRHYSYFVLCKFESFMNLTKEDYILDLNQSLAALIRKVMTGKDLGYEIRLQYGHLEIDCINSGSRATYYIYAISEEFYDKLTDWFWQDIDLDLKEIKNIGTQEEKIIPMEIK